MLPVRRAARLALLAAAAVLAGSALAAPAAPAAVVLPPGFSLRTAFSGLEQPTSIRFATNGLVFVAERGGTIEVFDGLADTTPTQVVNLRREVFNDGDRGLLGLAVDPALEQGKPYIYALYARNVKLSAPNVVPAWGSAGGGNPDTTDVDSCPTLYDQGTGCEVSGRLVRIPVDPATGVATGAPQPMLTGWCQQFSSHSVGDLGFGANRTLYVSGGEGASYDSIDSGQFGNVCGDPPGQGGALRAQDLLTPFPADPTGFSGSILRIDPDTAAAAPGNPLLGSADPTGNEQRIVATGLRNPYRFAFRPGAAADDLWVGDVGWYRWEELNRLTAPFGAARNFGWPCYEGNHLGSTPNPEYQFGVPAACGPSALSPASLTGPVFAYFHTTSQGQCFPAQTLDNYDGPFDGASVTGVAFYADGSYPASYRDGLFFTDYARGCLWFMGASGGVPDPAKVTQFARWDASDPYAPDLGAVSLERGPGGDVFVVDMSGGRVRRLQYGAAVDLTASATRGASPLPVDFTAAGAVASAGQTITGYDWDFDGDGGIDEHTTGAATSHVFAAKGAYQAKVTVRFSGGDSDASDAVPVMVDPPTDVGISSPSDPAALRWSVGDTLPVAGSGQAGDGGAPLAGEDLSWSLVIRHCAEGGDCHSHAADSQLSGLGPGNTGSAGVLTGPDHAYPSHLELRLTAHDPDIPALTTSTTMRLDPATVQVLVTSDPAGRTLGAAVKSGRGPILCTVIRRSLTTVAAAARETDAGRSFVFRDWSDGGAAEHSVRPDADLTLTAAYTSSPRAVAPPEVAGTATVGAVLTARGASFDGSPVTTERRWERCSASGGGCTPIPGASGTTHRVAPGEVGARLRVRVAAANAAGDAEAISALTAVVRGAPIRATRAWRVPVTVACPRGARCRASVRIVLERARRTTLARSLPFTLAPGRSRAVAVPLTRSARTTLGRRRTLAAVSIVSVRSGTRAPQVVQTPFTLLARSR